MNWILTDKSEVKGVQKI